jgi:hypothetical protein
LHYHFALITKCRKPLLSRSLIKEVKMKLDKRTLLGGLCVMAALATFAFKYTPELLTKETSPPPKPVARSVMQDYSTTQPIKKVMLTNHPAVDWKREFQSSTDYFPLIAKAAKAGLKGDGRAAYYVSRKWLECASFAHQYGSAEHPEEKFNEDMSKFAYAPPELIEKKRRQFQECSGFYKPNHPNGNDVFADLPNREGGYKSAQFWMDLAYQNNDPVAQTVHAASAVSSTLPNSGQIQVAQADLNHAIASGDPDALFNAGIVITNGLYTDRIQGFALSLAACDLGHDCTAANSSGSDFPFGECVVMGTCAPGTVFSDWVTKNIGAEGYAQAYARAQQIQNALAQGNTSALQQFAKLKD